MKIKIKCSVKNLRAQGLPISEAQRLSGNVVEATEAGVGNRYYRVSGDPRSWLFTAKEVSLVDADGTTTTAAAAVYSGDELQFWQLCYAAVISGGSNNHDAYGIANVAVDDLRSRKLLVSNADL